MTRPDRARRVRRHAIVPVDPSHAVPILDRLKPRSAGWPRVAEADSPAVDRPRPSSRSSPGAGPSSFPRRPYGWQKRLRGV